MWTNKAARALILRPSSSSVLVLRTIPASAALPKTNPLPEEFVEDVSNKPAALPKKPLRTTASSAILIAKTNADDWNKMAPNGLVSAYLQLSKHRLTMLITTTAVGGLMMSPAPFSWQVLAACTIGTALMSASANACNHLLEAPYDAQMKRTQARVLVIHRFSPLHALSFASVTAISGISLLWLGCNEVTAALGLLNLALYAGVYTPMKRYHIGCTWAGAVVGAIPPLMGYTALTGTIDSAALVLAAMLYSWQFPHFNGLSWNLRADYSRAGYRVMCVTNEALCRRTTIRHAVSLLALSSVAAPLGNLTTYAFALESLPLNAVMVYLSYKFYKQPDSKSARTLFRYSLLYLPLIMVLMVISNFGRSSNDKRLPPATVHVSPNNALPGTSIFPI